MYWVIHPLLTPRFNVCPVFIHTDSYLIFRPIINKTLHTLHMDAELATLARQDLVHLLARIDELINCGGLYVCLHIC